MQGLNAQLQLLAAATALPGQPAGGGGPSQARAVTAALRQLLGRGAGLEAALREAGLPALLGGRRALRAGQGRAQESANGR